MGDFLLQKKSAMVKKKCNIIAALISMRVCMPLEGNFFCNFMAFSCNFVAYFPAILWHIFLRFCGIFFLQFCGRFFFNFVTYISAIFLQIFWQFFCRFSCNFVANFPAIWWQIFFFNFVTDFPAILWQISLQFYGRFSCNFVAYFSAIVLQIFLQSNTATSANSPLVLSNKIIE